VNAPANAARLVPSVLSIAGSDSGGGAGIQADLKAFARSGVHGTTAITAVTWQNTLEVRDVTPLSAAAIVGQVQAVMDDIGADAVKVGMLGSVETVEAVDRAFDLIGAVPIVIDPVMVAESGARLLEQDAVLALSGLIGRATVVTPNVEEARVLVEAAGDDPGGEPAELARAIGALGPRLVVVTGGHLDGDHVVDTIFDGEEVDRWVGPRHESRAAHGSGCTHSATLAAQLALGYEPIEAAKRASAIASDAVRNGLAGIGQGAGPVDVFGLGRFDLPPNPSDGE